ncbi:M15 family metallopeptidase [Dongshaea marina]|uniref:M15 family metallopeptidase n=1 Tax=Dongshaea marina TaxID=2047966 RepID=UPI000D3E1F87|nr:M15 family metallopeptidase [Dongshaea marina]
MSQFEQPIVADYQQATEQECIALCEQQELVTLPEHPRWRLENSYYRVGLDGALPLMWVRRSVLERLYRMLELIPESQGILIFDTYRNGATSLAIFEHIRDSIWREHSDWDLQQVESYTRKFCAHPTDKGHYAIPPHKSGGAIDLALFELKTGKMLDYGCEFDDLTQVAQTRFFETSWSEELPFSEKRWLEAQKNRRTLFNMMKTLGFANYQGEWWHYDLGDCIWAELRNAGQWLYQDAAELLAETQAV